MEESPKFYLHNGFDSFIVGLGPMRFALCFQCGTGSPEWGSKYVNSFRGKLLFVGKTNFKSPAFYDMGQ